MKDGFKITLWVTAVMIIIAIAIMLVCYQLVTNNAKEKAFSDIDKITPAEFGLLLGTTPQTRIGNRQNLFFKYRIDAAEQLYKAGKIEKILISGDENSLDGINEPECMRDSLVAKGIPSKDIILDGKGFRTICSVINACQRYGLKSYIVISQQFHNERTLYLAEHIDMNMERLQAYNAKSPTSEWAFLTYLREYFARVKMFLDLWKYDHEDIMKNPF